MDIEELGPDTTGEEGYTKKFNISSAGKQIATISQIDGVCAVDFALTSDNFYTHLFLDIVKETKNKITEKREIDPNLNSVSVKMVHANDITPLSATMVLDKEPNEQKGSLLQEENHDDELNDTDFSGIILLHQNFAGKPEDIKVILNLDLRDELSHIFKRLSTVTTTIEECTEMVSKVLDKMNLPQPKAY